jgi:hypothetical protein
MRTKFRRWLPQVARVKTTNLEQTRSPVLHFLGIGPARTATTWLHNVLQAKTNLPVSVKETRFFDMYFHRGVGWYQAQFGTIREDLPIGEMAPTSFHLPTVQQRVRQLAPDAKIICSLREPIERLYSLYRYKRHLANFRWDFARAVVDDLEMSESMLYAKHLRLWIEGFGRANVLVLLYEDLRRNPQAYVEQICQFIGIPRFQLEASATISVNGSEQLRPPQNYLAARAINLASWLISDLRLSPVFALFRRAGLKELLLPRVVRFDKEFEPLDPAFVSQLRERLAPEIDALEEIIGRDLSSWKARARELVATAYRHSTANSD